MSIVHTPSITHLDPIVPCPNIRQSSGFHGGRGREWCGRRALRLLVGWLIITILKIRWGNDRVGPQGRMKMASHRSAELMCCWIGRWSQKVNMKPLGGWMLRCNWEVKVDQGVALFSVSINKKVLWEPGCSAAAQRLEMFVIVLFLSVACLTYLQQLQIRRTFLIPSCWLIYLNRRW